LTSTIAVAVGRKVERGERGIHKSGECYHYGDEERGRAKSEENGQKLRKKEYPLRCPTAHPRRPGLG
jgi:hypothetical protein